MEVYNVYNEEFVEEHLLFVYVFRAVSDINLYLSSVVNRFVYFYTQSDIRALLGVSIALRSFKECLFRE